MEQDQPEQLDYELVEADRAGIFRLLHHGVDCLCPFYPIIPQMDQRGNVIPTQAVCSTICPLAQVHTRTYRDRPDEGEKVEKNYFTIFCGGQPLERQVKLTRNSPIETVKSMKDVKIISLDR